MALFMKRANVYLRYGKRLAIVFPTSKPESPGLISRAPVEGEIHQVFPHP